MLINVRTANHFYWLATTAKVLIGQLKQYTLQFTYQCKNGRQSCVCR